MRHRSFKCISSQKILVQVFNGATEGPETQRHVDAPEFSCMSRARKCSIDAASVVQRRPDVIVMAVTSQILRPAGALGEVLIADWQGAGLPKASLLKPRSGHD